MNQNRKCNNKNPRNEFDVSLKRKKDSSKNDPS
jgi:hypothetical protein